MSDQPVLQVKDLSFRYHSRPDTAIEQISFDLQAGELLLVAGASGCGKTTLARCINGLIPRSYHGDRSGSVQVKGKEVGEMSLVEVAQQVGTLLQDPERQIVSSYVSGEIAFGLENLGLPREEIYRRMDEVFDRLKLNHLRDRETFTLSGGEKQKVALAGVLVMRPSVLLLDEPLASLDPASAYEAIQIFRNLADEGTAILLIEHRVEDALQAHPDRLLYMEDGRVRYLGAVDTLPKQINYHAVKLPAPWVVQQVAQESKKLISAYPPVPADPQAEILVSFKNVSFAYGDGPEVLHEINLDVRQGDLIAVLGPNGAGKSTLVKHAIGLLKPTRGQVLINGTDSRKQSVAQIARTIGYVFQSPTHMLFAPTVREEISFGPENLKHTKEDIQSSVAESLSVVNLVGLEEYPPLGLSFGQQKRTTIAAVLAMRSQIMVLDEPTAGQDYANYTRFMEMLCRTQDEEGRSLLTANFKATLFITHDLDLAVTYANRILLVSAGKLVADGPPESVLRDFKLLESCRVRPTSLLHMNLEMLPKTGHFLPVEALAQHHPSFRSDSNHSISTGF